MKEQTGNEKSREAERDKWSRIQTQVKKKAAKFKRFECKGSGRNEKDEAPPPLTGFEEKVADLIGDLAIEGIEGGIDMDLDESDGLKVMMTIM